MDDRRGSTVRSATTWLDDLTDDELATLAEQALEEELMRCTAAYDHGQAIALRHLRGLVSDLLNDSPGECKIDQ